MAQICAVSYVLMLDLLERWALAMTQAAAIARMLGSGVQVPSWFDVRADFDTALAEEPKRVDPKAQAMLIAVGLREVD